MKNCPDSVQAVLDWWWLRARDVLEGQWRSLVLFGSVAQDDFCPGWSDVDVAVFLHRSLTAEQQRSLRTLDKEMHEGFVKRGEAGWRSTQTLEAKVHVSDGETLAPFDRLQIARFGVLLDGPPVAVDAPSRDELVADVPWLLDDLERAPGDFSPIRLAGLMQEAARMVVFWRDGDFVTKTAALEAEIASGSPQREAYRLALALRREGSAACARHLEELRRTMEGFAPSVRALLLDLIGAE